MDHPNHGHSLSRYYIINAVKHQVWIDNLNVDDIKSIGANDSYQISQDQWVFYNKLITVY